MRLKPIVTALCAGALLAASPFASAKDLQAIGVTVGDLANPFFVQSPRGRAGSAQAGGDKVKVTLVSSGYDLGQQVAQIDNFIAAKVDMIILNAADSKGIGPAVKRAKEAGIVVVAVDVAAEGADATITSDNTQAGAMACKYISDRLNNKGNVGDYQRAAGFRGAEPR
ncbi:periplasmic binding protein/LacI transcriptional regulator [Klebsiella aerogenes]|nr:periplasmic binding protein/LacI transcriptional regulator [Klebsiella aerogenes]